MRICHVITRLIVGGAQENTVLSCEGLCRRGHEVTLIAGPETGPEGSLWDSAEGSGARLVRLNTLRRAPNPVNDFRCLRALARLIRSGGFDVVHTHSSKAGILGRRAAFSAGARCVVHTIHGMSFNRTQGPITRRFYRSLERSVAARTDAFVTVADAMAVQAVAAGLGPREKFTTIRSGMRTELYAPDPARRAEVRSAWGAKDGDVVVGTVARLFRNKGYEALIEAMAPAVACAPSLRFVWVGDGAHRSRYVDRVRKLGLSNRLHLTGLVPPEAVPDLIGGFDMVVHASRWEGLPRVLVQGLLMETPGVSFDIDGAAEVIEDGATGRLVALDDAAGLSGAIAELARSPQLRKRLGVEGRRRCLGPFSVENMIDALEKTYQRVLKGKSAR